MLSVDILVCLKRFFPILDSHHADLEVFCYFLHRLSIQKHLHSSSLYKFVTKQICKWKESTDSKDGMQSITSKTGSYQEQIIELKKQMSEGISSGITSRKRMSDGENNRQQINIVKIVAKFVIDTKKDLNKFQVLCLSFILCSFLNNRFPKSKINVFSKFLKISNNKKIKQIIKAKVKIFQKIQKNVKHYKSSQKQKKLQTLIKHNINVVENDKNVCN
ncbi:hypothetical protein RFI_31383 [Reticulomyxa filosa]|uniref:Uncharacterized protein n=1 Tax=Reticulomyxa filosa TaxID=46433 RepID=X6LZ52_RETFI|nr:hypothetical protein RFI_31383 [Reticulomyxa filosa]|eukprot:ETO06015.1 hypothetical protein RFI_31383 [Reticulomyxa filosa]